MKIIIRRSTVQITDELHTRVIPKDNPHYWSEISSALEKYLKNSGIKPDLKASYDELENSICIQGGSIWEKDWIQHVLKTKNYQRYYYE